MRCANTLKNLDNLVTSCVSISNYNFKKNINSFKKKFMKKKNVFYLAALIVLAAGLHSCTKDAMSTANAGNSQPLAKAESNLVTPLAKTKPTVTTTTVTSITQTPAVAM